MGTPPSLLLWCFTSLEYVYFKSYIKNGCFMLKKWTNTDGQDYCSATLRTLKDIAGYGILCKKNLWVKCGPWNMPHQDGTFFFKGWTYLYVLNLQIFIIYLFIEEFIFYCYMKMLQREENNNKSPFIVPLFCCGVFVCKEDIFITIIKDRIRSWVSF